ncbi:hypothetical protein LTR10_018697 [Elasticomyces elasticus]|uniref:EthD domain-containing protein n=1 Tax=Exophiala sideris TaxID=1016849 RepID=A0ABR0JT25_9EURO|nr:hypothetical protein LTR10_018697 [Elasticomyces elasticus]KAK5040444.1 hypothetical protein LTS07_000942 [Exophiala sideris]KAK5043130.1 hypothetical protein LTR13_000901 [Exophiala sideris]KAK5068822.1 hypothetical protein LTR69_000943 [Exophiala sideris]KAK5186419.1 hypothetical protein LTR44_001475 [Eurotiomycetes sp. CCFEE 6388]
MTLTKIDHTFTHQQLSYDAKPNYQPYIRISFFFSKLDHVSYEQFHRHFETVHADLTVASKAFKDCHIGRYVQFHQTPELKEKAKELGLPQLEYDGCSDLYVKSWDDWMKFCKSPEYTAVMNPDAIYFMALPVYVMVGYDNLIFGEATPRIGSSAGVTEEDL